MAIPLSDLHVPSEFSYSSTQNADPRSSTGHGWSMHDLNCETYHLSIIKALYDKWDAQQLAYVDRNPLPALPLMARPRRCCTRFTDKLLNHIPPQLLSGVSYVGTEGSRITGVVVTFVGVALKGARWLLLSKHFTSQISRPECHISALLTRSPFPLLSMPAILLHQLEMTLLALCPAGRHLARRPFFVLTQTSYSSAIYVSIPTFKSPGKTRTRVGNISGSVGLVQVPTTTRTGAVC